MNDCCEALWSVGLLSYAELPYITDAKSNHGIEIHSIIIQYIFDNESDKAFTNLDDLEHAMKHDVSSFYKYTMDYMIHYIIGDSSFNVMSYINFIDSMTILKGMALYLQILPKTVVKDFPSENYTYFIKLKRNTFMKIREVYKNIVSLLDSGKTDEATAIVNKEVDDFQQHIQQYVSVAFHQPINYNFMKSALKNYFKLRNKLLDCFMVYEQYTRTNS